jgi:hypothetical protein
MRIFSIIHKIGITTLVTLNFPTHMYKQTKINNKNLKYYNKKKVSKHDKQSFTHTGASSKVQFAILWMEYEYIIEHSLFSCCILPVTFCQSLARPEPIRPHFPL